MLSLPYFIIISKKSSILILLLCGKLSCVLRVHHVLRMAQLAHHVAPVGLNPRGRGGSCAIHGGRTRWPSCRWNFASLRMQCEVSQHLLVIQGFHVFVIW